MFRRSFIAAGLTALMSLPAVAQSPGQVADISIVPGWRQADGNHVAGLSIRLAKGWKTYWRSPGDSGIPPSFNWSGSQNVEGVAVHFPVPEVYYQNGLRSIGYKGDVLLPLIIDTKDASRPVELRGEIELGVCEEICVPVTVRITADLVPGQAARGALEAALSDRPAEGDAMSCEIEPISDGLKVRLSTEMTPMADDEVAVVEASEAGLWISEAKVTREGQTLFAEVEMVPPDAQPFALVRSALRLTVLAGGRAVEILGCS